MTTRAFQNSRVLLSVLLAVSVTGLSTTTKLFANDLHNKCSDLLANFHPEGADALLLADARTNAKTDVHTLADLLTSDVQKNLAAQHPWLVMNAAQRLLSLIYAQGVSEIADPNTGAGKVKVYNLFSKGVSAASGRRIVGQLRAIETLVSQIEAAARGERSGLYPPLLVGGPGTGKSEALQIFRTVLLHETLQNPAAYNYSFEFVGLENIPAAQQHLPNGIEHPAIKCPMHDSPLALLPPDFQKAVSNLASPKVKEAIGLKANHKHELCPHCAYYQQTIIEHYTHEKNKNANGKAVALTQSEVLNALNNHIRIRRVILGDPGTAPLIAAQGKDVDYAGLFVAKNPIEFINSGAGHPLSYLYTGALLGGKGSVVFLDEIGKNPRELRNKFLNTIQDRSVQEGGAPLIPLDSMFITATNTDDIKEILEKEPKSPFVDRFVRIPMNWSIRPDEVAKTLVYELPSLKVTKLGDPDAKSVSARSILDEFIPMAESKVPVVTPDRRFNLIIEDGKDDVHVSPHALMYLSNIVALSRMNFDPKKVEKFSEYPIVTSPVYSDPASRLKAIMGGIDSFTQAQAIELWTLSSLTNEGTFGITARDASRWLNETIKEARKESNGSCITPTLIKDVLKQLVIDRKIGESDEERMRILTFAQLVAQHFTMPALVADINEAISGSQDGAIKQIYDEIIEEMMAVHQAPDATTYIPVNGSNQPVSIRKERLKEVAKIFKQQTGRELAFGEISLFHMYINRSNPKTKGSDRHRELLSAIAAWQADKIASAHEASVGKVISIASGRTQGSAEEKDLAGKLFENLKHGLGYCKHCAAKAIELRQEQGK